MRRIKELLTGEFGRYVVVGGTTTLIDLALFFVLCEMLGLNATLSNITSITVSMLYAYVANKFLVFRTHCETKRDLWEEFVKFVSSRIGTMGLEIGSVFVFSDLLGVDGMISKLATQVIIFIANYLLSKFWAFRGKNQKEQ